MFGIVRVWALIGGLLLSHGAVLWLGRSLSPRGEAARGMEEAVREALPAPEPRPSPQEWLRRGREREERVAKQQESFPGEVEAARLRLAATGADVASLATAGMRNLGRSVGAETVAAFGLWLEREPQAALRELELWLKGHEWGAEEAFSSEIGRFLERGERPPLRELIAAVPGVREFVHEAAIARISERDAGLAVRLLREFDDPGERLELFTSRYLEADRFTGHLAAIRREFDDAEAGVFLRHLRHSEGVQELLPEIRAAGFPAADLARFERDLAEVDPPSEEDLTVTGQIRRRLDEPLDLWRLGGAFAAQVPGFYDWCDDAGDGRMDAEEVITRAKATLPGGAALDRELRMLAFWELIRPSPREAVHLLRKGGVDWPNECSESLRIIRAEQLGNFLQEFPVQGSLAPQIRSQIVAKFQEWHGKDPEPCARAIRSFPDAALRGELTKKVLEEGTK